MPELLIELFCEEIPARMQARAAEDFSRVFGERCAALVEAPPLTFHGPRRIGLSALLRASVDRPGKEERGPRVGAPDSALEGFLRKHGAAREALVQDGAFWVLRKPGETVEARALVAAALPAMIRGFPWPKSMRWGGTSSMTWVRPLKRVVCVLDGAVVPFDLRAGDDDGHGLVSGNETEGHRVMAPGAFAVRGLTDYQEGLRERRVVLDAAERARLIREGITELAWAEGLVMVPDDALVAEVAGLVEWPIPLLGSIDADFMDLPVEVMRTTMRVNQRYFALRYADGSPISSPEPDPVRGSAAPRFALVANIAAPDGGAAIVAGNERVLRARLSDARFFWDLDRKQSLESFLPKLDSVVFHAKLGTQGQRVARLERLARVIAGRLWPDDAAVADDAARAAKLAKADLASGMVGEFPELQGVMGRYYALAQGEAPRVAEAIGAHYRPAGPGDDVPGEPVAIAVALADKIDQLAGFFGVGERPTGSGDPFALRRAALGIIRILRENGLRLGLHGVLEQALAGYVEQWRGSPWLAGEPKQVAPLLHSAAIRQELLDGAARLEGEGLSPQERVLVRLMDFASVTDLRERGVAIYLVPQTGAAGELTRIFRTTDAVVLPEAAVLARDLLDFIADRLRVQLRAEGTRHDVVTAVLGATPDDDLNRLLRRADSVRAFVESDAGANLLAAYKRAANILRIEEKRDGHAFDTGYEHHLLKAEAEQALAAALEAAAARIDLDLSAEDFERAMDAMATLRAPVDAFFDKVIVNDPAPELRRNRLKLLARLRVTMDAVADFSKIEA
ncbi:glycine--tRNA ligase subunit beta [Roseomonas fluvialis]|uniref:Glycine--tRNA ligase beta subunit n=1 Tax=Roseomonas fluvialis TaxID=1750527 RepID=A0ABM7Y7C0_9PROT|nr:glycine--tRNA ligase subunit beta [Roseomonas fluvialis]BDG73905.1 glycine--tRNA ligase beta subunit [Roseomonas fluvialis]